MLWCLSLQPPHVLGHSPAPTLLGTPTSAPKGWDTSPCHSPPLWAAQHCCMTLASSNRVLAGELLGMMASVVFLSISGKVLSIVVWTTGGSSWCPEGQGRRKLH